LEIVENCWLRSIDFLFYGLKEGYIVEFEIECGESFSVVDFFFAKAPRGRYLLEIPV